MILFSKTALFLFLLMALGLGQKKTNSLLLEFKKGAQAWNAGNWQEALHALAAMKPTDIPAKTYQHALLVDAFIQLKRFQEADSAADSALALKLNRTWQQYFWEKKFFLFPHLINDTNQQISLLEKMRTRSLSVRIKIAVLIEILRLKGFKGRPGISDDVVNELMDYEILDARRDSIYDLIAKNTKPGDWSENLELILARYEFRRSFYDSAIVRCKLLATSKDPNLLKEMRLLHPFAHYKKEDYASALKYYQRYLDLYGDHSEVILQISRAYRKMGRYDKKELWYDKFITAFPTHDKTEEILWTRGWDAEEKGNFAEAYLWYQKLLDKFSHGNWGQWARYRMGYCAYKEKKYPEALSHFEESYKNSKGILVTPASLFWQGKILDALDSSKRASEMYYRCYREFPLNFYGQLARLAMAETRRWTKKVHLEFVPSTYGEDSLKKWMKNNLKSFQQSWDSGSVRSEIGFNDLLALGLEELVRLSFEDLYERNRSNPWFLYYYSKLFFSTWEVRSYWLARSISFQVEQVKWKELSLEYLKMLFPQPFHRTVMDYAQKRNLHPHFIYALMKQESGFAPKISSWAGAIGLMQMMPATGKMVAKWEGLDNYHPSHLTVPEINIRLGTAYLDSLRKDFDNNLYLVLANYNAGPKRARRWETNYANLPLEEFTEEVTFRETRDYIRKVMGNYWAYSVIYQE